jgi:hypothetical protein
MFGVLLIFRIFFKGIKTDTKSDCFHFKVNFTKKTGLSESGFIFR